MKYWTYEDLRSGIAIPESILAIAERTLRSFQPYVTEPRLRLVRIGGHDDHCDECAYEASLNMGSINFGLFPMLDRYKNFKHDWERPYLEGTDDLIFRNTFRDIAYALSQCRDAGTRFEFECYDTGHLYNLAHFVDRKLVRPPFFVQGVFGILGGIFGNCPTGSRRSRWHCQTPRPFCCDRENRR